MSGGNGGGGGGGVGGGGRGSVEIFVVFIGNFADGTASIRGTGFLFFQENVITKSSTDSSALSTLFYFSSFFPNIYLSISKLIRYDKKLSNQMKHLFIFEFCI